MSTLLHVLSGVPAAAAYLILAVVVLAESVPLVVSFVPTVTDLLTAGRWPPTAGSRWGSSLPGGRGGRHR